MTNRGNVAAALVAAVFAIVAALLIVTDAATAERPLVLQAVSNSDVGSGCRGVSSFGCVGESGSADTFEVRVRDVTALRPREYQRTAVTFDNPHEFPISVTSLRVQVGEPEVPARRAGSGPACSAEDLIGPRGVVELATPVPVLAGDRARTSLGFGLLPSAPASCRAARWPLVVTAWAVKP